MQQPETFILSLENVFGIWQQATNAKIWIVYSRKKHFIAQCLKVQ